MWTSGSALRVVPCVSTLMLRRLFVLLVLGAALPATVSGADKILKEGFGSGGRPRTYYLYVPEGITEANPAPLLVLLHGSGRNGLSQAEQWKTLAKKERLILAAPDSVDPAGWNMGPDGPDYIHDLVDIVAATHPVNTRRVYLFGHSAGAIHGLGLGLLESEYFAAVAVHAGALAPEMGPFVERASRKIPFAIWVGTSDALFPLSVVRATRDVLAARGFPVTLSEVIGHTHNYYDRSVQINQEAWAFLQRHVLETDPVFTKYDVAR